MGFTDFIGNHIFGIAITIMILALIWQYGVKPRLGLTDGEIEKKITDTMDEIEENLTLDPEDLFDEDSMPNFKG